MTSRNILIGVFILSCWLFLACQEESDDGGSQKSTVTQEAVRFKDIEGDWGDIKIGIILNPEDWESRSLSLLYSGACAGESWVEPEIEGATRDLPPGIYTLVWHSWEQEAGCSGEVRFRVETDRGESAESEPVNLDNASGAHAGFFEFPFGEQGIQDGEEPVFEQALEVLLDDPSVDFVATRRGDTYEVYAERGSVFFRRIPTRLGYEHVEDEIRGENPIGVQDETLFPTLDEELAAGSNPNNVSIPEKGYPAGDPRLSFIEPEDDSYPFAYERIAAYFDHPSAADFMINWKGYAHAGLDLGEHGSLNMVQSRSPLIFWGRGIEPGTITESCRQVDIAPTAARLLGLPKTYGVDERGMWSHKVYLGWQDGHVIEEALNGQTTGHLMILVFDGMTHTELIHQVQDNCDLLPNLARLAEEGAWSRYGSTTNWPSVTYPSHNVVGAGLYGGHHGLVDNQYYDRVGGKIVDPVNDIFFTERFWDPVGPGESLHQAIHRAWGAYGLIDKEGAVTASLFDPSVVGATKADLEFRDLTFQSPFPPLFEPWPKEIPIPKPNVDCPEAYFEQYAGYFDMVEIFNLFGNGVSPMPVYMIVNHPSTDGFGHSNGPHHDAMGNLLKYIDDTLGVLFDWLDAWGIADDFTVILTSDHGMQIGDPSRSGWPPDALAAAGIRFVPDTFLGIYLKTMAAKFSADTLIAGQEQDVDIWIFDEDTHRAIAGATVSADDGQGTIEVTADDSGHAVLTINPAGEVAVTLTHPDFNARMYILKAD